MTSLQAFISVILICLGFGVSILILMAIGLAIYSWFDQIAMKYYHMGEQSQYEKDRNRLQTASFWFGEDIPTQKLIHDLAEGGDAWAIRDRWRNARKILVNEK